MLNLGTVSDLMKTIKILFIRDLTKYKMLLLSNYPDFKIINLTVIAFPVRYNN